MSSIAKASYLPDNWDNDMEMSGLMSFLKARHVNPTNYDRVVDFWKRVISDYCHCQKNCVFTLDELKIKFKRGSQLPSPLPTVVAELQSNGIILTKEDFEKQDQGWLQWSFSLLKPNNWFQGFVSPNSSNNHFELVHLPTLKELARELLFFYRNNYELTVDCPDVVDYNDLHCQTSHIIDENCFELVIKELVRIGEVSVGHSKSGDKVLKFKDQSSKGPARFTETDANVHDIRRTMNRLDLEIKKAEQKEQKLKEEAKAVLGRKDKKGALNVMRKVAHVRKDIQDKDVQYQRLLGILHQLAASKQTKEIIEIYKQGSNAFKETMARQGLTTDNVDTTVESMIETMQDYQDVEEALREGFKGLPSAGDSVDEAELESELNELIREGAEREQKMDMQKPVTPIVVSPIPFADNHVRVGKRVLDLNDLPEVPTGGLINTQPSSSSENGASLEERWKRLRMHAT